MEVINDRAAIVTGVSDKIGEAICLRLAAKGAKVAAADRDSNRIGKIVERIKDLGGRAIGLTLDPTEASEVNNAVEQAQSEFGRLDILINNIDEGIHHQISGLGLESWHKALYINLDPVVLFCREAIPRMRQQHHGRVINILSLNYLGLPETAYYAASKSGIFGFSRALALESAKYDITVNCVVKGDIQDREIAEEEEISQIASGIPCKRMGRPEDIARTVGFFASDTSKYITGQTFFVCGGKSVYFSMSV